MVIGATLAVGCLPRCWRRLVCLGLVLSLGGCATNHGANGYPNQRALLNKPKAEVLSCAGRPMRETIRDGLTILTYYNHPPGLDRSTVTSKGSVPVPHYGCWADLFFEHDLVSRVEYRSESARAGAADECEELFDACT